MAELARRGFVSTSPRRPLSSAPRRDMATGAQLALIKRLWAAYAGAPDAEKGLRTWLAPRFGASDLRFLSSFDAPRVIAALRAMVAWRERRLGTQEPAAPAQS